MPGRNAWSGTIPAIVARAAASAAVCATLAACSATTPPPGGRLTARQQILATEAIDSALAQVRWPKLDGRSVFVEIGAPSEDDERAYLKNAVSAALAENGARLAPDAESADYILLVLGKAVGVDEERTFFGIPALESSLLPIGLPEIALYLAQEEVGIAQLQTVLADRRRGGVKARSGPVDSEVWVRDKRVLFFSSHETNSTKLERTENGETRSKPPSGDRSAAPSRRRT